MFSSGTCSTVDQRPCQILSHQTNKTLSVTLYFFVSENTALRSHTFRSQLTPTHSRWARDWRSAWDLHLGPARRQSRPYAAPQALQDTWTLTEAWGPLENPGGRTLRPSALFTKCAVQHGCAQRNNFHGSVFHSRKSQFSLLCSRVASWVACRSASQGIRADTSGGCVHYQARCSGEHISQLVLTWSPFLPTVHSAAVVHSRPSVHVPEVT